MPKLEEAQLQMPCDDRRAIGSLVATPPVPRLSPFDGQSSRDPDGSVVSWAWTFGDGASGTGPVVTHTYTAPGVYFADLDVVDNDGNHNLMRHRTRVAVATDVAVTASITPAPRRRETPSRSWPP